MYTAESSCGNDRDWGQGREVNDKEFDLHCNR